MPLRPFAPLPKAADVNRRERSWVLTAGSRHFSFTRIDHSASFSTSHRIEVPASRTWRPTTIMGTMLALVGGATLLGLAINSSRAAAGYRYVVSVPVPPLRSVTSRDVATKLPAPHRRRPVAVTPVSPAIATAIRKTRQDYVIGDLDTPETTAAATSATAAIRAAMATGHLQQWSDPDGNERGFVVVGPAEAAERGCRSLSILTRTDGENRVESRRECPSKSDIANRR